MASRRKNILPTGVLERFLRFAVILCLALPAGAQEVSPQLFQEALDAYRQQQEQPQRRRFCRLSRWTLSWWEGRWSCGFEISESTEESCCNYQQPTLVSNVLA